MKAANPEVTAAADITKLLSEAWKAASVAVKAPYEAKAKVKAVSIIFGRSPFQGRRHWKK